MYVYMYIYIYTYIVTVEAGVSVKWRIRMCHDSFTCDKTHSFVSSLIVCGKRPIPYILVVPVEAGASGRRPSYIKIYTDIYILHSMQSPQSPAWKTPIYIYICIYIYSERRGRCLSGRALRWLHRMQISIYLCTYIYVCIYVYLYTDVRV